MTQSKIPSNFFDAIGVADMEKVHSAVIGWMLSDKCEAFDIDTRSKLLQQIFGIEGDQEVFDKIDSFIEWKNIDILIVTTKGDQKKCWVIENKIKSSQHSDQLNRYVDTINCEYLLPSSAYKKICEIRDNNEKTCSEKEVEVKEFIDGLSPKNKPKNDFHSLDKHYCFLTLIKEDPKYGRPGASWVNTKYEDVLDYLKRALKPADTKGKDRVIVDEYVLCVESLVKAFKDFMEHYQNYDNVFNDGEKTKEEKLQQWANPNYKKPQGEYASFISENGLETIFQKQFLSSIIPNTPFSNDEMLSCDVKETHGTALVDFTCKKISFKNGSAIFGFQFQNGTFKVQIAEVYNTGNNKDEMSDKDKEARVKYFFEKWDILVPDDKKQRTDERTKVWTIYRSHGNKKPYISFCLTKKADWFKQRPDTIIKVWQDSYAKCTSMMDFVIDSYINYLLPQK